MALLDALREEAKNQEHGKVGDGAWAADLFREAVAEIERLQALPKGGEVTRDGVPIVPGMMLYLGYGSGCIGKGKVECSVVDIDSRDYTRRYRSAVCYSTQAAAEAARGK